MAPAPAAPWDLQTEGAQRLGRRLALQTRACPDCTCRAPIPGLQALAELHLPWARPPWAAYLALGCRPRPAHILLCLRRPDCTARISYLMGRGRLPTSPSYMAQVTSPPSLCCPPLLIRVSQEQTDHDARGL